MIKGYFHIIAIGMTIAIVIQWHQLYFLLLLLIAWLIYLYVYQHVPVLVIFLTIIFSVFSIYYIPTLSKLTSLAHQVDMKQTEFYGTVTGSLEQTEKIVQFTFQPIDMDGKFQVIYFIQGKNLESHQIETIKSGANCFVKGNLELPDRATNPFQFDYQQYLLKKKITHQLMISSLSHISCDGSSPIQPIHYVRNQLIQTLTLKLNPNTLQWVQALVLGDKSHIDEQTIQLFQRWSLSHILAISGLHVGIIAAIIYYILIRFSILTKEKAQWFIIIFLPIYAILAGSEPSVWRASLMVVCFVLIQKLKWNVSYTDVVSILYIIFILVDPLIIYHIGFQLSFLVTFGIIISRNWLIQSNNKLIQLLKISFISQMIILPLQINYFHIFQPLSIILNVIVVPYYTLIVIPLMFSLQITIYFLPSFIIHITEIFFEQMNHYMFMFLHFIDEKLYYPYVVGHFPVYVSLVYYCLLILLMMSFEKMNKQKVMRWTFIICIFMMILKLRPYMSNEGIVTMLDIGQGDAFIIELPYRKGVIMIDAGAMVQFDEGETSNRVYEQVIKPYLYGRGIQKVDTIFISHEHVDHYGSVAFILDDFSVDHIVLSNLYNLEDQFAQKWANNGASIERTNFGDVVASKEHNFHVLSPRIDFNDANENSMILLTSIGGLTWLFTGDAGKKAEHEMLRSIDSFDVDVLKVGHHGSDTSTGLSLLESVNPAYSLVPVGRNNRYNHPSKEVIELLEENGITIYRSDEHGAVQYRFRKEQGQFHHFLK